MQATPRSIPRRALLGAALPLVALACAPRLPPTPTIPVTTSAASVPPTSVPVTPTLVPPTETAVPPSPTVPPATSTPVPTSVPATLVAGTSAMAATATPTAVPPTATVVPSSPTAIPATPTAALPPDFKTTFSIRPLVVMVENHPDARPQAGLGAADVIYEAVTEWGITRFMAVFANRDTAVVGPVRSARHYFAQWAEEYNGLYAFAGASPQGYATLKNSPLAKLDYTMGEGAYWRAKEREAPHNLYADTVALRTSARGSDRAPGRLAGLTFKPVESPVPSISRIAIAYPDGYTVRYTYQRTNNNWTRMMVGQPHIDAISGTQYRAKNVLVQLVETWPVRGDDAGRVDMQITGEGVAYAFLDGRSIKGRWRKGGLADPTRFVDASGNAIELNPGQTWIQVLPDDGKVTID